MTVLLIDGVGHIREMEIRYPLHEILVPIPVALRIVDGVLSPELIAVPIARFVRSEELSYPPVYRQRYE